MGEARSTGIRCESEEGVRAWGGRALPPRPIHTTWRGATLLRPLGMAAPLVVLCAVGVAQTSSTRPAYHAADLDCAQFVQAIHSEVRTVFGSRISRRESGREAVVIVRAHTTATGLRLVAWFDSLSLWEQSDAGRSSPDTDGLVGGRYRGRLSADGIYVSEEVPFIPDELAAVADLLHAMDDLLPRLPPVSLPVGSVWEDTSGVRIRRLADSAGAAGPLQRYSLTAKRMRSGTRQFNDTTPFQFQETQEEKGQMVWDAASGLLRWQRTIAAESEVPAGGLLKQPIRASLRQNEVLERLPAPAPECR